MNDRTTRFSAAVLLTVRDIAAFNRFLGVIRLTLSGFSWIRTALGLLLTVWTASAAVLWRNAVDYDLRQVLCERHGAFKLNPSPMPKELRGDGDV